PRSERADLVFDFRGGMRPVDGALLLFEARRFGGQTFFLFDWLGCARFKLVDHSEHGFCAHFRKSRFELFGILVGADWSSLLGQKRASIETRRHLNYAAAGLGFAIEDCPLDGCSAAILGQK